MATLPVIADTFRCALNWTTSGGQIAVNVIHIHTVTSGKTAADVDEVLEDQVGSNLWLSVSSTAQVTDIAITPLDGVSATQHFVPAVPAGWTGGQAGDFSPATAAIVKIPTDQRGRSKRGRVFLPFTGESVMANGVLDNTTRSSMETQWNTFQAALKADPDTPCFICVASYKLASQREPLALSVEHLLATQRRRQGRLRGA